MDERLHQVLDGDRSADELPDSLYAEAKAAEALFGAVLRAVPAPPVGPLGNSVLQRIASLEDPATPLYAPAKERPRLREWLWAPHHVSFAMRPVFALAAAALLLAVIGISTARTDRGRNTPSIAAGVKTEVLVHFRLDAPRARAVSLAGDFSNWHPEHALQRASNGVWMIVIPLTPGVHDYSFVIDGERWVPDPSAAPIADGFGGTNSRIAVLGPDKRT